MKVLITGVAGFIGYHVALRVLEQGGEVVGLDNLNDYYDPTLKEARLNRLRAQAGFSFTQGDIADRDLVEKLFQANDFEHVVHLAAQAGVRYSITNPYAYIDANLVGFANILENSRQKQVQHLLYASSSSVYGANERMPFSESDNVDHPVSLYAATKKANELMAHTYSHLYKLPTTGLRFFTVYGPWGRPDMALFLFTKAILAGEPIDVYNNGDMLRDFTYIDDIVDGIVGLLATPASPDPEWTGETPDPATSMAPYRVYNIGCSDPVELKEFIAAIEDALGVQAKKNFMPIQPGDVPATFADVTKLAREIGYQPKVHVREGVKRFVAWYREYYGQ